MPTNVSEITSLNWQIAASGPGEVAQGVSDIAQAISIILNTRPGSDPLRPSFGSAWFEYIDAPIDVAQAGLRNAVTRDVERWEPRVRVASVESVITSTGVDFTVVWNTVLDGASGEAYFSFAGWPSGENIAVQPPDITYTNPTANPLQTVSETLNWQLSLDAFGSTVTGAAEISQAIVIAITNMPGSDVLRPLFGGGLWQHVDTPVDVAGPNMAQAIRQAVLMWEPRAVVKSLSYFYRHQPGEEGVPSGLVFDIGWQLRGDDVVGQTRLLLQLLNSGEQFTAPTITITILATESGAALTTEAGAAIQVT